jgi:hypothetical protein
MLVAPASLSALLSKQSQDSNLRRLLCPLSVQRTHPERSAPSALRTNLRSEGSHPIPATQPAPSVAPTLSPLALSKVEGSTHASQTGAPPGSTGAASSPQTANSFRINTYKPTPQLLILNHLQETLSALDATLIKNAGRGADDHLIRAQGCQNEDWESREELKRGTPAPLPA